MGTSSHRGFSEPLPVGEGASCVTTHGAEDFNRVTERHSFSE
ncbi:hypothetical protein FTUN_2872 [Frigoriglobus tundricola]|uniref:Uncharacterized protein n=1 Tax=Frigoriglobus tundricola TaxID=2774151 RepID=A0A6M5YMZ0_9BACT|nr:hypothetical protein FTUN_2872 [Frigoriglobus tundricola]